MQRSIPFLWVLVILLLIVNLLVLDVLNLARLTAIEALGKVEATLDSLANEVIVYNVEVNQAVPMKAEVPLNRTIEVPLRTTVPIDQVLRVPFQTPAGEIMLEVPVNTEVPIDMVVPVDFNQTITVDTVVELDTTLPVEIAIAKTPLAGYLAQAKADVAQLRRRLSLRGRSEQTPEAAAPNSTSGIAVSDSSSPAPSIQPGEKSSISGPGTESNALQGSPLTAGDLPLALDYSDLGPCAHPYWPLWLGGSWTYNSPDTSYTQNVADISSSQVLLGTRYEDQEIQSSLACPPEGLGGSFLGDVRRIAELGELEFSNPRGTFLARPEAMEERRSWTQDLDVSGTVQATRGDSLLEGRVNRGRASAVYTPVGFETVDTPLGPQEALRVEQRLDFQLDIGFDLDGQSIPVTEIVNLSTTYWFVKGIGLVKTHWQGGTIHYTAEFGDHSVNQQSPVPALAEDQLVIVCVTLADGSEKCAQLAGISQPDLTPPPRSELAIQAFAFPDVVGPEQGPGLAGTAVTRITPTSEGQGARRPEGEGDDGRSALLEYAASVERVVRQLSEAAQEFWEVALRYQTGQLTRDEFRSEFQDFASEVRGLIAQINRLSPPPAARSIHQELSGGLAKCDQAINLMYDWFDNPSSDTQEAAALLVAECIEDVTAASDKLMQP